MADRLKGKRALIIGGNSGIGLATAKAFVDEGATVMVTGRDEATLAAAEADLGVVGVRCDIGSMADLDAVMAEVKARLDGLDVLFINAGTGAFRPVEQMSETLYDQIMTTNLRGAFFAFQKAIPLLANPASVILNSSLGWFKALPGNSVYSASKAGLRAFGRNWAAEFVDRGVRVNVVSPGPVDTPIIARTDGLPPEQIPHMKAQMEQAVPMKRMGRADELAAAVVFLASDESSFITGIDLLVDGGAGSF